MERKNLDGDVKAQVAQTARPKVLGQGIGLGSQKSANSVIRAHVI